MTLGELGDALVSLEIHHLHVRRFHNGDYVVQAAETTVGLCAGPGAADLAQAIEACLERVREKRRGT